MGYVLGIDFGTTYTAAAVCEDGRSPVMVALGAEGYSIPTVLFVRDDGTFLVGDAAELRASSDPTRVTRHFKQRLGDTTPIRLGSRPYAADDLLAQLLWWIQNHVWERRGEAPASVVLTHPANWGPHRQSLLRAAAVKGGLVEPVLIPEPAAAAIHYVRSERVDLGDLIGIYDLGGGTFDAVVMRRTATGFEVVGVPSGIDSLGGLTFDGAIRSFVMETAGLDDIDDTDDDAIAAAYALRASCVAAKRALSADTVADVRAVFPSVSTTVRITRTEFEDRIRSHLLQTMAAFESAVASADIGVGDLERILLVGGSSRIPLVKYLLEQRFARPVTVDIEPKNSVALGAALYGAIRAGRTADPSAPSAASASSAQSSEPLPSTDPVTSNPSWRSAPPPTAPTAPAGGVLEPADRRDDDDELDEVAAESMHRARITSPPPPPAPPPIEGPTDAEPIGVDRRLVAALAALAVVVVVVVLVLLLA